MKVTFKSEVTVTIINTRVANRFVLQFGRDVANRHRVLPNSDEQHFLEELLQSEGTPVLLEGAATIFLEIES